MLMACMLLMLINCLHTVYIAFRHAVVFALWFKNICLDYP